MNTVKHYRISRQRRLADKRRSQNKHDRRRRFELRLRGLTSRGTPLKVEIWPKHLFHGCKTQHDKNMVRQRIYRERYVRAGLTKEGKQRNPNYHFWPELSHLHGRERNIRRTVMANRIQRQRERQTPLERQWRNEREQMDIKVQTWEDVDTSRERALTGSK